MSAFDADNLLERAGQALDRDIPTIDEVMAELAATLDKLEREFPDGKPGEGASSGVLLDYMNLVSKVKRCRWQLEDGWCVEFPRGRRSWLESKESKASWEAFINEHPELGDRGDDAR